MLNMTDDTSSEECVAERGCACCLASRNAELLERADKLSAEVTVLSRREGRFRRLYRRCGTKSELVDSCEGIKSEVLSESFDRDVDDFPSGFSEGYSFEEVVLISDGNCNGGSCVYSVSRMWTSFSCG